MNDKTKDSIFLKKDEKNNIQCFPVKEEYKNVKGLNLEEFLNITPDSLDNVVFPWLPNRGLAFVYAYSGVGKTLFTLNIAYMIAQGGNFLKYLSPLPRKVLYVDGEMSFKDLHSRLKLIKHQQGKLDFPENLTIFNLEKINLNRMPDISLEEGQSFYNRYILENDIEVIILDNLSMLSSHDEMSSEQWKPIQDWLVYLRSIGKSVIVVHHSGKGQDGFRGSSRMIDCLDSAILLKAVENPENEEEASRAKKIKIIYQKNRSFYGKDALSFEAEITPEGWKHQSMEKNNTQRIIEMAGELKMKASEITLELGIHRSRVYKVIKDAKRAGLIRE